MYDMMYYVKLGMEIVLVDKKKLSLNGLINQCRIYLNKSMSNAYGK